METHISSIYEWHGIAPSKFCIYVKIDNKWAYVGTVSSKITADTTAELLKNIKTSA